MTKTILISSVSELRQTVSDVMMLIQEIEELTTEKEFNIRLCLRELLSNSLIYSGCETIRFTYQLSDDCFRFSVMDRGSGFTPCITSACPDVFKESGRGIFLVSKLADDIRYNKKGTAVVVRFYY